MVDCVDQQVTQRLAHHLDDLAIEFDVLTGSIEPDVLAKLAPEVANELRKGLGGLPELGVGKSHRQILEVPDRLGQPAKLRPPGRHELLGIGAIELNQGQVGQRLRVEADFDGLVDELIEVDRVDPGRTGHHRPLNCGQEPAQRGRSELVLGLSPRQGQRDAVLARAATVQSHFGAGDRLAQLGGHPRLFLLGGFRQEDGELFKRPDDGTGWDQITGLDALPGVLEQGPGMAGLAEPDDPR